MIEIKRSYYFDVFQRNKNYGLIGDQTVELQGNYGEPAELWRVINDAGVEFNVDIVQLVEVPALDKVEVERGDVKSVKEASVWEVKGDDGVEGEKVGSFLEDRVLGGGCHLELIGDLRLRCE